MEYHNFIVIDDDFWNLLKMRVSSSMITDVFDGTEYSKLARPGGFLCPTTLIYHLASTQMVWHFTNRPKQKFGHSFL